VRQVIASSEGGRALRLLKKREDTKARAEAEKQNIENETRKRKVKDISQQFGCSRADTLEEEFKKQTIGLVSAAEFKARRQAIDELIEATQKKGSEKQLRLKRKVNSNKLSFEDDVGAESDDDDDASGSGSEKEEARPRQKKMGKDPTIDTSFLYDADREADMEKKRRQLIAEYNRDQEAAKHEKLDITYSYWDGSGHRRSLLCEKGYTIGRFLAEAKADLEKTDFPELRTVGVDSLMYVKEDLIIPSNVTFYNLIKDRARGKSGPLFHFDVHDDIRQNNNDVRVEKDESHAGKIVDRKWYERNKHIFPASRWEMYSKDKTWDQYTIHGDKDHSRFLNQVDK